MDLGVQTFEILLDRTILGIEGSKPWEDVLFDDILDSLVDYL